MSATILRHGSAKLPRRTVSTYPRPINAIICSAVTSRSGYVPLSRVTTGQTCGRLRPARRVVRVMAYAAEVSDDAYICLGLAQCFRKAGGGLEPVLVVEPLSASSLECLANGARTSYKLVTGVSFGDALHRNRDALPDAFRDAPFCENYEFRCEAAARTWQRPHAQDNLMDIVPLGKIRSNFNFSLEDKRILNMDNIVNDSDNIKQDMSIDVYGRKKAEDLKAKQATEVAAAKAAEEARAIKKQKEEDDLDALLLA
ncbi:hypothetical protein Vretimale_5447 [Volvox reticuliferus]|uniref:Uncharacterized protein n=1 Tax=Volvox reticuliferus TaxID=1737510 RepID=A0A8J4C360_9CHLO|nr:hypothetical protein Vretifemale_3804 [Volvox reticuliferus]GIM00298.1 hypothetical protein Vretimale_5447 [Volvox reticuliferus]